MRSRLSCIFSYLAVAAIFVAPFIMLFFEQEREEAISGGVIIGASIGSIFGIVAIILNKQRRKLVYFLSAIPMVPLALFLLMAIPFYLYK